MEIKVEGQPCSNNCGGKYVKNPKTNKIFCENKCWLNNPQPQQTPTQKFDNQLSQDQNDEKWKRLGEGKVRHGFAIEAYKKGQKLIDSVGEIQQWVHYVMTGKLLEKPEPPTGNEDIDVDKIDF